MTYDEALSAKLDAEDTYNADIREAETEFSIAESLFNRRIEYAELALANAVDLFNARIEGTYP